MENLSNEKIQLEIIELKKPLYKKLEFYKSAFPMVAIVLTIIFTFYTGIIDVRRELLSLTKSKLEFDIVQFESKKDSLYKEIQNLKFTKDSLNELISDKSKLLNNAHYLLKQQSQSINNLALKLKLTQEQKEILVDENQSNMQNVSSLFQTISQNENDANSKINELTQTLKFKEEVLSKSFSFIQDLANKYRFSEIDSAIWKYIEHGNSMGKFSLGWGHEIGKMQIEELHKTNQ